MTVAGVNVPVFQCSCCDVLEKLKSVPEHDV